MPAGTLDLHDIRLHYDEQGAAGSAVVFIHGWASSSRMWAPQLEALASRHRCLALDLPGHGMSSKPPLRWYSLANFVSMTHGFVRGLDAQEVSLVGHSLGGTIALEFALRYPRQVRSLVLVNPVITGRLQFNLHWFSRRVPGRFFVNLTRRAWPRLAARLQLALAEDRLPFFPEGYHRRNLDDLTRTTADSLMGSAQAVHNDLTPRLGEVRCPTLVIVGSRDRTVPPGDGRLAAQRIPGARLVELATDHHPGDEAPEDFRRALRDFLDQPLPGAS